MGIRAFLDEAKATYEITTMAIRPDGQIDPQLSARAIMFQAYNLAAKQINVDVNAISDQDHAEVLCVAIRNVTTGGEILNMSLTMLALQAYVDQVWLSMKPPLPSFNAFLDFSLPEDKSDRIYRLKSNLLLSIPNIMAPLREKPIQLKDGRVISDQTFADSPSIIQDLIPMARQLDTDKPRDRKRFEKLVTVAATQNRDQLRDTLVKEGFRTSDRQVTWGKRETYQVIAEGGELLHATRLTVELLSIHDVEWVERQLFKRVRFSGAAHIKSEGVTTNAPQARQPA